jgi:quercetin dioxygenase-like cupin family protein
VQRDRIGTWEVSGLTGTALPLPARINWPAREGEIQYYDPEAHPLGARIMQPLTAGITKAGTGIDGISWNILGQTYVPKQVCENSFAWHATFPPGTSVPPHIHPTQNEFIYMLEGGLDLLIDGKEYTATSGDLIRMPMNISHGIFNKTDQTAKCFFWVAPTRKLYDLFWAIHSMKEQSPAEVVALAAKHEVLFLPPPA